MVEKTSPCPCGGKEYGGCWPRYHNGAPAPDAEALMRSRYSAYVLKLEPYLLVTWHPSTCPPALDLAADNAKWIGLQVKKLERPSADHSTVEFVARCRIGGRAQRLHEISRFVREDGRWYYVDGEFPD